MFSHSGSLNRKGENFRFCPGTEPVLSPWLETLQWISINGTVLCVTRPINMLLTNDFTTFSLLFTSLSLRFHSFSLPFLTFLSVQILCKFKRENIENNFKILLNC